MIEQWQAYLQQAGAQFEGDVVSHFGEPDSERQTAHEGDILADLSYLSVIKISGNDAEQFLQGQFTNDVTQVNANQSQLSAWCSPKGRILVTFLLLKRDNAYYLVLPQDSVATTLKRLQLYVLRANVQLEVANQQLVRLGIAGNKSTQLLNDYYNGELPSSINTSLTIEQTTIIRIPGTQPRYFLLTATPQPIWHSLAQQIRPVGAAIWQWLDIQAGLPQIGAATSDEFVPQMVNYPVIGGVSFKKGCYTGQEVVARMQYLGSLKRRMYLAKITTTTLPQPGDTLYLANEQNVGKIVNAQWDSPNSVLVLAVIQITHAQQDDIHWQTPQGEILQLLDLPYSLPS